jgi:hypothetical protein
MANELDQPERSESIDALINMCMKTLSEVVGEAVLDSLAGNVPQPDPLLFGNLSYGHPLGIAWKDITAARASILDKQEPKITKEFCIGMSLSKYLEDLKDSGNLSRVLNDIARPENEGKFYKAFYECHIASGFKSLGYDVHFVEEGTKKTPDLELYMGEQRIYVECKSLDPPRNNNRTWKSILQRITKFCDYFEKCYSILIYSSDDPRDVDIKCLCNDIREHVDGDQEGLVYSHDGKYRIYLQKLSDDYHKYMEQFDYNYPDQQQVLTRVLTDDIVKGFYAPLFFGVNSEKKTPLLAVLRNNFRNAKEKFREYSQYPCIIYLEINANDAKDISNKMDVCDFYIRQQLAKNRYIDAVVINAYLYRYDIEWPFQQYSNIILNRNSRISFEELKLYGIAYPLIERLDNSKNSVVLYCSTEGWDKHLDKLILIKEFFDKSIENQISFWKVDNKFFKLLYTHPEAERVICKKLWDERFDGKLAALITTFDKDIGEVNFLVSGKPCEVEIAFREYSERDLIVLEIMDIYIQKCDSIINDILIIINQCQGDMINEEMSYEDILNGYEGKIDRNYLAYSNLLGLLAKLESLSAPDAMSEHKQMISELITNVIAIFKMNLHFIAEFLYWKDREAKHYTLGFFRNYRKIQQNIFVLLNKIVADNRYYKWELGNLFLD